MELYKKLLNGVKDANNRIRCASYKKLREFVVSDPGELTHHDKREIIYSSLRGFEDSSERCREEAVKIVAHLVSGEGPDILDWVLPSVVTRIGISPVVESSEEIRLLLLRLASQCITLFPHDIGPRNFIDYFQVLLENCFADEFPELKKEACKAANELCAVEPQQVKLISTSLAKALKKTCLMHKHSAVRSESVSTLAVLFKHGASAALLDGKEESERETTASQLFVLANDHSEAVRVAVLNTLSCALLDVKERLELHSKYLPHLLLLSTDSFERVRTDAINVFEKVGKLYLLDNEDNRIDMSQRRVSMKDIEWYGDDEYPSTVDLDYYLSSYPILQTRPPLGVRYAVAEAARGFLEKVLSDVCSIDWIIPFSTNNRKAVALRILWNTIFHCEKASVQFAERILSSLYRVLRDDSEDVRVEATLCVEILGRFLTPDHYLPFLIAKGDVEEREETTFIQKLSMKTVVLSSVGEDRIVKVPTLFSTAASTTKCSILVALGYLVRGSRSQLLPQHATRIVQALTSSQLLDSDNEDIFLCLLSMLPDLFAVFAGRQFFPSPACPLPADVKDDPRQRTLDSILFYALLCIKGTPFSSVKAKATACIEVLSSLVSGTPAGIYSLHIRRLLLRYGSTMPVTAFTDLVLNATEKEDLGVPIKNVFIARLGSVDFSLKMTDELQYFTVLERTLWNCDIYFTKADLEELLKIIVLPLSAFHPGSAAHLFRKVSINCLCALCRKEYRDQIADLLLVNDLAVGTKVETLWCSASDSDDGEMRLVCMTAFADVCKLPMTAGCASEIIQSMLLRFDDSNDMIRLKTVIGLQLIVKDPSSVNPLIMGEIMAQMVPLVKKALVYLDDQEDDIGIRVVLRDVLQRLGELSPNIVIDLVRSVISKHEKQELCQVILDHVTSLHA